MSGLRRTLAAALLTALALPSVVLVSTATATETPTESPTETPTESGTPAVTGSSSAIPSATPTTTGPFTVDDAQLRWGVNDESNNAAFAPGTFNFFSAGELSDPGAGGQTLTNGGASWSNGKPADWSAASGEVRLEKRRTDGSYAPATFAGVSTDAAGTRLTTSGSTFSDHQVVIDGGTGTVDPTAGTAAVSWKGTFTVLYYSGMTFYTVSDPQLVVTATTAQLTGTLGGYASDMVDQTKWVKVPGQQVVLADLPRDGLQLPSAGGFSATPAYLGVRYDAPADGVAQVRTGSSWGAFPTTFLQAMQRLGSGAYWYSSGGSADAHKVPLPLTVSYSAGDPIAVPAKAEPTKNPTKKPTKDPTTTPTSSVAPSPPATTTSPNAATQPIGPDVPAQATAVVPPGTAPVADAAPQTFDPRLPTVPVVTAETAPVASPATSSGHPWEWWTGSVLLLGAAVITTVSTISSRVKGQS